MGIEETCKIVFIHILLVEIIYLVNCRDLFLYAVIVCPYPPVLNAEVNHMTPGSLSQMPFLKCVCHVKDLNHIAGGIKSTIYPTIPVKRLLHKHHSIAGYIHSRLPIRHIAFVIECQKHPSSYQAKCNQSRDYYSHCSSYIHPVPESAKGSIFPLRLLLCILPVASVQFFANSSYLLHLLSAFPAGIKMLLNQQPAVLT